MDLPELSCWICEKKMPMEKMTTLQGESKYGPYTLYFCSPECKATYEAQKAAEKKT